MADRRGKARKSRTPRLTRIEKLTKGLLVERSENDFFAVKEIPEKGRGVFLRTEILRKDSFVLEYKGDVITEAEASYRERIYALNNEGCFIMSFSYQGTKLAVDATRHFDSFARLLNHSREPNIRFHAPFVIDLKGKGLPRIASYALRDIYKGEEIVIDYGIRDGHISWLRNREIGFAADVDSDSSGSTCPENSRTECQMSEKVSSVNPSPDDDVSSVVTSAEMFTLNRTDGQIIEWNNTSIENNGSLGGEFALHLSKMVPGSRSKNFVSVLTDIGVPQKIFRSIENTSKKKKVRSDAGSVVCLSTSSSSVSKLSETTFSRTNVFSCPKLPSNKTPNSIHKVLEWQTSPVQVDTTVGDIQIINIQSLSDPPCGEKNSHIDHSISYRQQSSSAFQSQANHINHFDQSLRMFHKNDPPSVSKHSLVSPSAMATQSNAHALVVNVDTSDSDDKSESSRFSSISIRMIEGPLPSLGEEAVKAKTASVEPADVYVVSDDECAPKIGTSGQQLKCADKQNVSQESCSAVLSSTSECEVIEDKDCEIIWSELPALCNEQGKLASNWPARRPVGFSSSSTQQKVAVIKPYVTPSADGAIQNDAVDMTESELEQLKVIFHELIFYNKSSHQHVQQAIYRNWAFFSVLINKGVSISQIRTTVNNLFKKT